MPRRQMARMGAMSSGEKRENLSDLEQFRRRIPVGEGALFPFRKLGPPTKTGWLLRRCDEYIQRIKGHPECQNVQAAGYWNITLLSSGVEVRLAVMAIGMGCLPHGPDDISAAFINEHDFGCRGLLENLTTQDRLPVLFIGDTEANDCFASVNNVKRQWAQKALAAVSALPPWSWDDYLRARAFFKEQFPTKMAMWEHFARQSPPDSH